MLLFLPGGGERVSGMVRLTTRQRPAAVVVRACIRRVARPSRTPQMAASQPSAVDELARQRR